MQRYEFTLKYNEHIVGWLTPFDGAWFFDYDQGFYKLGLTAIGPEFSDFHKAYFSKTLWAFFSTRIPSTKRQEIKDIVEKEGVDPEDQIAMLKLFGRKVIQNPYELIYREYVW
jgi:hypothetical protein